MNITDLLSLSRKIEPYAKGTHTMWTDEYISKNLLEYHINPDNEIASRSAANIDRTVDWIIGEYNKEEGEILDLGCGPGLYTKRLSEKGFNVTGVDFSENSIRYAEQKAKEE